MTPLEFYYATKDFEFTESLKVKPLAETIRMSTFWLVNMQITDRARKIKKPKKLWIFPWEKEHEEASLAEMKQKVYGIAAAFGLKVKQKNKQ